MNQISKAPGGANALVSFQNLIGGKSEDAQDGAVLDVLCPSDGKAFATLPR